MITYDGVEDNLKYNKFLSLLSTAKLKKKKKTERLIVYFS